MKTKKHNKRRNKVGLKGGANDSNSDSEAKPTPSYMKYNLIMLGLSSAYIFFKLTKA
jgi:hypothetical protein